MATWDIEDIKHLATLLVYSLIFSVDYWSDKAANTQVADNLCNYSTTGRDGIKKKKATFTADNRGLQQLPSPLTGLAAC